ncbi:hypothetical protein ISS37_08020 [candidate division KSB1 bacterium]|nr:hypothetical protein [candidate division KSB1 bacterium]
MDSAVSPEHSGQSAINNPLSHGDWNRIEFSPTSTNSRMSWCKVVF